LKSHSSILAITFGFLIINIFLESKIVLYIIILLSGLSLISNKFSDFIEKLWLSLALLLSKIVPNILLTIIFFLILTPLAFLSKIFKAETDFQSKNNSDTIFKEVNKTFKKETFERGW